MQVFHLIGFVLACGECAIASWNAPGFTPSIVPSVSKPSCFRPSKGCKYAIVPSVSTPSIVDIKLDFTDSWPGQDGDAKTVDVDININGFKIRREEVRCTGVAVAIAHPGWSDKFTFPNTGNTGDCMGDALRRQKKDPSKYWMEIDSRTGYGNRIIFHSDGYPDFHLVSVAADPVGAYEGSALLPLPCLGVNFDIKMDFTDSTINNQDGLILKTVDLEINSTAGNGLQVKCTGEAVAMAFGKVTFPNTGNTGDCMGDALRAQWREPFFYFMDINVHGSGPYFADGLTFNSDDECVPQIKLKKTAFDEEATKPSILV